jgi:D-alanine transaminase
VRVAYVNGSYRRFAEATVHVEDRGYQFADGVYEVIAVHRGRLVDEDPHFDRLSRSLGETRIAWPMSPRALRLVVREVLRRNRIGDRAVVYIQVTRGTAPRSHAFPVGATSSLVVSARAMPPLDTVSHRRGMSVISIPDMRWKRPDIKSIALLPNVLAKQSAIEAEAGEAWLVTDEGTVTEGTASNAWIVSPEGVLITHPVTPAILQGITRGAVLRLAADHGIPVDERPFTVDEAKSAAEAFVTGTTSLVRPVVRVDGTPVGTGATGPVTSRLLDLYLRHMENQPNGRGPARW